MLSLGAEGFEEAFRGSGSVRVLGLPLVAELGDRPLLALRDEHRVETEASGPSEPVGDSALEDAGAPELLALRREGDELADVPRATALAFDATKLRELGVKEVFTPGASTEDIVKWLSESVQPRE